MPSRRVTLAIVAFWLAVTGWMVYRAYWRQDGETLPVAFDLTDELGARFTVREVTWEVSQNGQPAGEARTGVRRTSDRLFEVRCEFPYPGLRCHALAVKKLNGTYRVTAKGEMRGLACTVAFELPWGFRDEVDVEGSSADGRFTSLVRRGGVAYGQPAVETAAHGWVLNVLGPLHKMEGLYAGRTWRVLLFDPRDVALVLGEGVGRVPLHAAVATVAAAPLAWEGKEIACWRIDYRESDAATVQVWVRAADGMVVRQDVRRGGPEVVLRRKVIR